MNEGFEDKDAFRKQQEKKVEFDAEELGNKVIQIKVSVTDDPEVNGYIELNPRFQIDPEENIPPPKLGYLFVNYIRVYPRNRGYGYLLYKQALKYSRVLGYKGLSSTKYKQVGAIKVWEKLPKTSDQYYDYLDTKALEILP